jgi:hypothetical protein
MEKAIYADGSAVKTIEERPPAVALLVVGQARESGSEDCGGAREGKIQTEKSEVRVTNAAAIGHC